jgi:Zn-dependent peptidase ImmA (M78 family)
LPTPRFAAEARLVLAKARLARPPVPVERIARANGLVIEYQPFAGDISGMLCRDTEPKIIGVNAAQPLARQRFTIAHELGHLFLHKGRPIIVDKAIRLGNARKDDPGSSLATRREEIEANGFAAELLMPRDLLMKEARALLKSRDTINDDDFVEDLAHRFRVSRPAMEIRLTSLGVLFTGALAGSETSR